MLRKLAIGAGWTLLASAALLLIVGVYNSSSYQQCKAEQTRSYREQTKKEEPAHVFVPTILRAQIALRCTGDFLDKNNAVVTALATVVIAIFTIILGVSTVRLSGSTRNAAEAALLNAKAVIDAERARLFLVIGVENITDMIRAASAQTFGRKGGEETNYALRLEYAFKNYGKTPATIQEMAHGVIIEPTLPSERKYQAVVDIPTRILAADETSYPLSVIDLPRMTPSVASSISMFENELWFYGHVVYDDMFGCTTTLNFVWHYDTPSRHFAWYSHSETQERRES